jgi:hypothetical protein
MNNMNKTVQRKGLLPVSVLFMLQDGAAQGFLE